MDSIITTSEHNHKPLHFVNIQSNRYIEQHVTQNASSFM